MKLVLIYAVWRAVDVILLCILRYAKIHVVRSPFLKTVKSLIDNSFKIRVSNYSNNGMVFSDKKY
ncbi:MAG: hypothetical protein MJK14_23815 [Rivularia sp. ALOHA_DT_140]|nr:hypothetical protein [Rivularia sp. ALOHA_DT_140]